LPGLHSYASDLNKDGRQQTCTSDQDKTNRVTD
jgi:hypothetical protein